MPECRNAVECTVPIVNNIETIRVKSPEMSLRHIQNRHSFISSLKDWALGFNLEEIITPKSLSSSVIQLKAYGHDLVILQRITQPFSARANEHWTRGAACRYTAAQFALDLHPIHRYYSAHFPTRLVGLSTQ